MNYSTTLTPSLGSDPARPDKCTIRRQMRAQRKALAPEEKAHASSVICEKLWRANDIQELRDPFESDGDGVTAVYLASSDEIDLTAFIERLLASDCPVVAPRWNGETYELARLKSLRAEDLRTGPMRIREPAEAEIVAPKDVAVWIVPGLAFTRDGRRLGYGGGWYDRLMAEADKNALRIGVAHTFQVVEDLLDEPHDVRLTAVVDDNLEHPLIRYEETSDGFCAQVSVDAPTHRSLQILWGVFSFVPLGLLVWYAHEFTLSSLSNIAFLGIIFAVMAAAMTGVVALMRAVPGAERVELEVRGEQGICRRWFFGWLPLRTRRFPWTVWTQVQADESQGRLWVSEGVGFRQLCRVSGSAAGALAVRMNLQRPTDAGTRVVAREKLLADLPKGMLPSREGAAETMAIACPSLAALREPAGCIGWLSAMAMLGTVLERWYALCLGALAVLATAALALYAVRLLWCLFGRFRVTVCGDRLSYVARLGPRVRRQTLTVKRKDGSPVVRRSAGGVWVMAEDCSEHCLFPTLPPHCILPLEQWMLRALDG